MRNNGNDNSPENSIDSIILVQTDKEIIFFQILKIYKILFNKK